MPTDAQLQARVGSLARDASAPVVSGDGTNFIATAFGRKRSGKSHELARMARIFPRRLIFDFVGEFAGKIDGAFTVHTLSEAVDMLQAARKRASRWTVVCIMQPDEVIDLCGVIAPVGKLPEQSFSYLAGGLVIECGELQLIAPNAGMSKPIANLFAMGRHYRVSLLGAARRPHEVNRLATSQSDAILAFRMHEPGDADYLKDAMRYDVPAHLRALQLRQYLRYLPNFGTLERVDENGVAQLIPDPQSPGA